MTILQYYVNLNVRTLKNIYQRFFYFPSVVGKPTSYSRHDLDNMVQPILERWQAEGIMILALRGSGDIWGWIPMKVKGMTGRNVPWFGDVVDKYESKINWLKQWMWIIVSITEAGFVARWNLICYKIWKRLVSKNT